MIVFLEMGSFVTAPLLMLVRATSSSWFVLASSVVPNRI